MTSFTSSINAVSAARLEINTAAEVTGTLPNSELLPFDYVAIGKVADLLQLMTYDQNGPDWSDPGPVAGAGS